MRTKVDWEFKYTYVKWYGWMNVRNEEVISLEDFMKLPDKEKRKLIRKYEELDVFKWKGKSTKIKPCPTRKSCNIINSFLDTN